MVFRTRLFRIYSGHGAARARAGTRVLDVRVRLVVAAGLLRGLLRVRVGLGIGLGRVSIGFASLGFVRVRVRARARARARVRVRVASGQLRVWARARVREFGSGLGSKQGPVSTYA